MFSAHSLSSPIRWAFSLFGMTIVSDEKKSASRSTPSNHTEDALGRKIALSYLWGRVQEFYILGDLDSAKIYESMLTRIENMSEEEYERMRGV
jgi:hypothetical protein